MLLSKAHSIAITCVVSLFNIYLFIYLIGYGFATFVVHDVASHKTCRNVQVTEGVISFVIFSTLDRIG